jgi:hypothetical protein
MSGSTYVSDPRIWKQFYKNILEGNFYHQRYKGRQTGGGIAGMYSKKPYMIPVNPHTPVQESKEVMGKRMTPLETGEERAKEDLKEEIRQNVPHVPANSIKVEKDLKSIRSLSATKTRARKRTVPKFLYSTGTNHKTKETYLDSNIFTPKRVRK